MKKMILCVVAVLAICTNINAQDADSVQGAGENKVALGLGAEFNMNSRENFAGGALLSFDYNLPKSFAVGITATASHNFDGITVIEPAALVRWYFLGGQKGFFLQADLGAYLILEEDQDFTAMFNGGLRAGYRLPFGSMFYFEPYGRGGYPFVFGVGAIIGLMF